MTAVLTRYIVDDANGRPVLEGTGIEVADIAIDTVIWGMTPQEICENHPQLSLAQVHAALAYYYDHRPEIDASVEQETRECADLRAARPNPVSRKELLRRRRTAEPSTGS